MNDVDTYASTEAAAYENADRFHDNMLVSEIIGTSMHVEDEEVYTPLTSAELETMFDRGFDLVAFALGESEHDWLED